MGRAARVVGLSLIACVWMIVVPTVLVSGSLLFLHIEGHYFLTPERTAVVSVVRSHAMSYDVGGGEISETYVMKFPSGEEGRVTLPAKAHLKDGERVQLRYRRSRVLGAIVVEDFQGVGASQNESPKP